MKNKKILYLLIPAVLFIWGLVIYQFFSYFETPDFPLSSVGNIKLTNQEVESPDTFQLLKKYADPFRMGKRVVTSGIDGESAPQKKKTSGRKERRRYVRLHWGKIRYLGQIEAKNDKIGLVWIAGKNHLLRESEERDGYKITALYEDSVIILYNNEERTFLKKNEKKW